VTKNETNCPLCQENTAAILLIGESFERFSCPACGSFQIASDAKETLLKTPAARLGVATSCQLAEEGCCVVVTMSGGSISWDAVPAASLKG